MEPRSGFTLKSKKSLLALVVAVILGVLFIIILVPSSGSKETKEQSLQIKMTDQIALVKQELINTQKEIEKLKSCNNFLTVLIVINFVLLVFLFFFSKKKGKKKDKKEEQKSLKKEAINPVAPKIENPVDEKE